jgi:xanthine dehydrogenase accessory factor
VQPLHTMKPVEAARTAPPNTRHLVMTHDHALDYALCREILARDEFAWLGLIGSDSKGARFRSRLRRDGLAPEQIDKLVCPIGVEGIASKSPAAIAIAVAAQLLQQLGPHAATHARSSSTDAGDCSARDCGSCHATHGAPR